MNNLNDIRDEARSFAAERDWEQFHTPRNLLLALVGEVGELAEIFQWKNEDFCKKNEKIEKNKKIEKNENDEDERIHVGEEMADCVIYLVRMADRCGIDLGEAIKRKIEMNKKKYPVNMCKGSSDKYTKYIEQ
eukprot:GHVL01004398.1.p1 GENE.GHVL01004398.1~~GHVL01004398.1.p1  ORF type:complete len:133 (+),score=50.62 GHVL01004398.1:11-409(+)